eukprot:UN25840
MLITFLIYFISFILMLIIKYILIFPLSYIIAPLEAVLEYLTYNRLFMGIFFMSSFINTTINRSISGVNIRTFRKVMSELDSTILNLDILSRPTNPDTLWDTISNLGKKLKKLIKGGALLGVLYLFDWFQISPYISLAFTGLLVHRGQQLTNMFGYILGFVFVGLLNFEQTR